MKAVTGHVVTPEALAEQEVERCISESPGAGVERLHAQAVGGVA